MTDSHNMHATCLSIGGRALLISGAPGMGKSSLALALMEQPGTGLSGAPLAASLIADDQTLLEQRHGHLWASCPAPLLGKLEVRGLGIIPVAPAAPAPVAMVVQLVAAQSIPRLPDEHDLRTTLLGVQLPLFRVDAATPAAASRVRLAWCRLALPAPPKEAVARSGHTS